MNIAQNELLRTNATFICLASILQKVQQNELTGCVRVNWEKTDTRLKSWVERKILPSAILENSSGSLFVKDGYLAGAVIGDGTVDLEQSLDVLLQMCYGIGCGVLPSTVLTLAEREVAETEAVGSIDFYKLTDRLFKIENSFWLGGCVRKGL